MATNYQGFQFNSPQPTQSQQGMFQSQQFFPQPQGNIYLINNFLEMANVPTGVGISAALCLSEGVMYLKTMQNGQPMVVGYKISPFDKEDNTPKEQPVQQDFYNPKLEEYEGRLKALEKEIEELKQKTGYNLNELIQ